MKQLAGFLVVLLALVGCKKEEKKAVKSERAAVVTFVKGTEARIDREGSGIAVKPGEFVFVKDVLVTGAKSNIDLQLSEDRVVKISEKSRVEISEMLATIDGATNDSLNLVAGGIYSKVGKLSKGSSFSVRTPTAVAGVRGTEFYVESDEQGQSSISVTGGKVEVESVTGEKSVVEEGQKAEVKKDGKVEEKGLAQAEIAKLKGYGDIKAFDKAEFAGISDKLKDVKLLKEKKMNFNELQQQFSPGGGKKSDVLDEQGKDLKEKGEQQMQQMKSKGDELRKSLSPDAMKGDSLKSDALKKADDINTPDTGKADKKVEEGKKELDKLKKKKLF